MYIFHSRESLRIKASGAQPLRVPGPVFRTPEKPTTYCCFQNFNTHILILLFFCVRIASGLKNTENGSENFPLPYIKNDRSEGLPAAGKVSLFYKIIKRMIKGGE